MCPRIVAYIAKSEHNGGPMRILIAEDDPDLRALIQALIRIGASEADEAADGEAALRAIAAKPYDLVVLDLMLPLVNGFDVYEAIKRQHPRPRVIVISAIARYFDDRFDKDVVILQKPFSNEEFLGALGG